MLPIVRFSSVVLVASVLVLGTTQAATFKQCSNVRAQQADVVLSVRVAKVLDGDTVDVRQSHESLRGLPYRVRIAEIDAPEKDQPYGKASSSTLSQLVAGKTVELRYRECDRYHRIIGKLFVAEHYVADDMVSRGAAWFNSQYGDSATLYGTENIARDAKRGLWVLPKRQFIEP